jgi:hypothetical protein
VYGESSSSSEGDEGRGGNSGMPLGGEGVRNSTLEMLDNDLLGGVERERTGSADSLGGEGGGVEVWDCGEFMAFCNRDKSSSCLGGDAETRGKEIILASGVLAIGESSSLPMNLKLE